MNDLRSWYMSMKMYILYSWKDAKQEETVQCNSKDYGRIFSSDILSWRCASKTKNAFQGYLAIAIQCFTLKLRFSSILL